MGFLDELKKLTKPYDDDDDFFSGEGVQEEDDDPYDAKDYRFPEDFYEDHWDDFFDYYDAEDYYYDHTRD